MNSNSDQNLAQFRAQSDQSFREMQEKADRAMVSFLNKYGGSPIAPNRSSPRQARVKQTPTAIEPTPVAPLKANPPEELKPVNEELQGESFVEQVASLSLGGVSKSQALDSWSDLQEDFSSVSTGMKRDVGAVGRDAIRGTSDIIKNSVSDLGQRAKAEAAAMRDAAKKAVQEERSLKGMKGRAAEEARKMKERVRDQVDEAKQEAIEGVQDLASEKFGILKGKLEGAFQIGKDALEREVDDLSSGKDS